MMSFKQHSNLLEEFVNDFAEGKLSKAELQSFSELQEQDSELQRYARSGMRARKNLRRLPKIGCRPGFEQRMAAKFAMELEREVHVANRSMHAKKSSIADVSTSFS